MLETKFLILVPVPECTKVIFAHACFSGGCTLVLLLGLMALQTQLSILMLELLLKATFSWNKVPHLSTFYVVLENSVFHKFSFLDHSD